LTALLPSTAAAALSALLHSLVVVVVVASTAFSVPSGKPQKVLLAKALASRPELLVLDNAFDGLDVPSRTALKELVSQTLRGFSQVLVQGIDASAAARTQVLLLTHRHEEMVPEIATVSIFGAGGQLGPSLTTAARDEGRLAETLGGVVEAARAHLVLPPESAIAEVWPVGGGSDEVVSAHGLRLLRGDSEVSSPAPLDSVPHGLSRALYVYHARV